jgi:hypothetical protein
MMVSATSDVVRIMGVWVRRADAGLARNAARNAASSLADLAAQRFEAARALRDLNAAFPTAPGIAPGTAPIEHLQGADVDDGAAAR